MGRRGCGQDRDRSVPDRSVQGECGRRRQQLDVLCHDYECKERECKKSDGLTIKFLKTPEPNDELERLCASDLAQDLPKGTTQKCMAAKKPKNPICVGNPESGECGAMDEDTQADASRIFMIICTMCHDGPAIEPTLQKSS